MPRDRSNPNPEIVEARQRGKKRRKVLIGLEGQGLIPPGLHIDRHGEVVVPRERIVPARPDGKWRNRRFPFSDFVRMVLNRQTSSDGVDIREQK